MSIFSDAENYLAQQFNAYVNQQRQAATSDVNANVNQQAAQAQADVQRQIQQEADKANAQIAYTGHVVEVAAWVAAGTVAIAAGYYLSKSSGR